MLVMGFSPALFCCCIWYNAGMTIHEFIRQRPHLIWYVTDYDALNEESIVEHVLNYGNWDDVQGMIRIMGIRRVANVFRKCAFRKRTNYYPDIKYYFNLYFNRYAQLS